MKKLGKNVVGFITKNYKSNKIRRKFVLSAITNHMSFKTK